MVGEQVTLADIFLTNVIIEVMQGILDNNFRGSLNNMNAHFKSIITLPEFVDRLGNVKPGKKQFMPPKFKNSKDKKEKVVTAKKQNKK